MAGGVWHLLSQARQTHLLVGSLSSVLTPMTEIRSCKYICLAAGSSTPFLAEQLCYVHLKSMIVTEQSGLGPFDGGP